MPEGVYKEVVNKELLKKYADAAVISDLVSKKLIKVVPVKRKSFRIPISMDKGEIEALAPWRVKRLPLSWQLMTGRR